MQRATCLLFAALLGACTTASVANDAVVSEDSSSDAPISSDAPALDAWSMPPEPTGTPPPNVPCAASDAGPGTASPCMHWVQCVGEDGGLRPWAATYTNGTCPAGTCVFTEPPVFEYCDYTCFNEGPTGRCAHPGPTAP